MAAELKPYRAYKDSEVEWLGPVPAHWEVRHLGRFGRLFKGGGGTKEDARESGVPCVRYGDLYTQHQFFITATRTCVTPELADAVYTPIRYGDVLFAGSGETIDEIGKSAVNLIPGPACCGGDVIILRPSIDADARFLGYAMDCTATARQKARIGRGFTVVHIYSSDLKYVTVAIPPLPEQAAIIRFLDHADQRIRRYIRAKEKLIALLKEQRQAIIREAVAGRIEINDGERCPAYRDSGVEWLGDVPAHWDVAALRHRYIQSLGKMLDSKQITGNHSLRYLRNIDVQWDSINTEDLPTMDIAPDEYDQYTLREGDLLVCEGGEVGRCALWSGELTDCGFQKALHRLRPLNVDQDVPRFMYYALRAAVRGEAFDDGHLSTIAHLTGDKLRAHRFPFPPVAEQHSVVGFLDAALEKTERAISRLSRQTELLHEYGTRLLAEVVTGKVDVRDAPTRLADVDVLGVEGDVGAEWAGSRHGTEEGHQVQAVPKHEARALRKALAR